MPGMRRLSERERVDLALEVAVTAATARSTAELAAALPAMMRLFGCGWAVSYYLSSIESRYFCPPGAADLVPDAAPYIADDPLIERKLSGVPDVVVLTDVVDRARYRRSAAYSGFYRRFQLETTMFVRSSPHDGEYVACLLLGSARQVWDPAALALARRLQPLLGVVAERERARALGDRLVLDLDGRLLWSTPATLARLGGQVPPGLRSAARRHALGRHTSSPQRLALPSPRGPLEAELRLTFSPRGARYVMVQLAAPPVSDAEQFRLSHGLSHAELAVLRALQQGRTNAAIARALGISPHTVRTHLYRIYDKLDVSTRLEAVLRMPPRVSGAQ